MDIMGMVKRVTGALRRWVEQNPVLAGTLMKVAAATAAITVGLGALAVAVAAVLGRWRLSGLACQCCQLKRYLLQPPLPHVQVACCVC